MTTPVAQPLLLHAKGVGQYAFGTAEATVEALLTARLGKPTDSYAGPVCELDDATAYGRQLGYGSVFLLFESAPKGTKSSARKLTGWLASTSEKPKAPLALAPELPATPTYDDLKAAFPTGTLEEIELGEGSFWVFTTPSGVWYRGEDNVAPDQIGAGPQQACE